MRTMFMKMAAASLGALTLVGVVLATSTTADARYYGHRGWRGGGWAGPAIVGGLALGALAASRPYYGGYGYGAYGYDDGCLRRRVVGHTVYGRPSAPSTFATDSSRPQRQRTQVCPVVFKTPA